MKILFCSSFVYNSSNGAAIFAQLFLDWCSDRKIAVDIVSSEKADLFIPLVTQNKLFTKFPILNQYHRSFIYYKTVKELLRTHDYDIVFFNSVVESLHTSRLISKTPVHAFLHDENFMNDYKQNASFKRRLYRNFMFRHEKKACQFLDKIWTNSKHMKDSLDSIYGIHPVKSSYFYFRSFDLQKLKVEKKNGTRILFIKHDYERGGLESLLDAVNSLDRDITLEVIGPPKNKHQNLKNRLRNKTLEIAEYKDRIGVQQAFQQADIFCVPSYSEALGLGNLEALAMNVPVVASNIPVMNELNKYEIFCIAQSHNPENIRNAILSILDNEAYRNKLIDKGRVFLQEILNKERVYKSMDDIIMV